MLLEPTRRSLVAGALAASAFAADVAGAATSRLASLEAKVGGRLGVAALDTASGARIDYRADEAFPICSTFKLLAVSALLSRVDRGEERLDRVVPYGPADLLDYAPVTRAHLAKGGLSLDALCAAAIELSDNVAANLILRQIGGPPAATAFARSLGDARTRLDRTEPTLNTAEPGDPRDTTTPAAMAANARALLLGQALRPASRRRLKAWMIACKTGGSRLRAGFPESWPVADKTGTGDRGTANDVAVAWTPKGPIVVASYLTGAVAATPAARDAVHAQVARMVVDRFRGSGPRTIHG